MTQREKIIVALMLLTVAYGIYALFFEGKGNSTSTEPAIVSSAAQLENLNAFITKVAEASKAGLSKEDKYIISRAETEWKQDPLITAELTDRPQDEIKKQRPFGPKSTKEAQQARIQRLYKRQLEGLPVRQLVLEHAAKEQIGIATAWRDWKGVYDLVAEDFERERTKMAGRIFMQRQRLFNAAMKRGQMQTAANVLDSLARQVGCDMPEQTSSLPEIRVTVEPPPEIAGSDAAQLPEADVIDIENEQHD